MIIIYRINQYRPNLRNRYGIVKTRQWSQKPSDVGIENILNAIRYECHSLKEDITELSITEYRGKIGAVWVRCSNPQYKWDNGYHKFAIRFRPTPKNHTFEYWENRVEIDNEALKKFIKGAEKYFKENDLNVKIYNDECEETTIEEILSSY